MRLNEVLNEVFGLNFYFLGKFTRNLFDFLKKFSGFS